MIGCDWELLTLVGLLVAVVGVVTGGLGRDWGVIGGYRYSPW